MLTAAGSVAAQGEAPDIFIIICLGGLIVACVCGLLGLMR